MFRFLSKTYSFFEFSSSSKIYDIISIGPYANRISKTLSKVSKIPLSILTIEQNPYVIEPTLVGVENNPEIKLKQDNHEFGVVEMGVGVKEIDLQNNTVLLKNGAKYQFKECVFSGDRSDWQENINYPSLDYVFSNKNYSNIGALKNKRHGNIIFTLPSESSEPLASESYLMALIKNEIKNNGRVVILGAVENSLKELLTSHQVEIYSEGKSEIDYENKKIRLSDQSVIPFEAIFHYLPTRVPPLLHLKSMANCGSPEELTSPTLTHPDNPNIHILPCFPSTPFSYINHLSKTIAQNIIYSTLNIKKRVSPPEYECNKYLWVSHNEVLNTEKFNENKLNFYVKAKTYWKKLWERANLEAEINMGCGTHRASKYPSIKISKKE